MSQEQMALKTVVVGMITNFVLGLVKLLTGVLGNSYALIADAIESFTDVLSSGVVWVGLKVASKPPDEDHPFGHGRAEQLAGLVTSISLLVAATVIATQSIHNIVHRHTSPAWFTLPVLGLIIIVKEVLSRVASRVSEESHSTSLKGDAWHHRADAITSAAAFIGISVALWGGDGYEKADDIAALLGCLIIYLNGFFLFKTAIYENMDGVPEKALLEEVRRIAGGVEGVEMIEKLRMKKHGLRYYTDIHVQVEGEATVRAGHTIAHAVKDVLLAANLNIYDVVVHIEPFDASRSSKAVN